MTQNDWNKRSGGYVGYEYREITVPREHVSLCLDSYSCFGWEPDRKREGQEGGKQAVHGALPKKRDMAILYFRRRRNISNKAELTRLQRNFDSCVMELRKLEQAKTSLAAAAALASGILGTAFMAGSVFAAVAEPPALGAMALLAVPGFAGWIAPYFLYRELTRRRTAEIEPLMEQKYDEIHSLCEKGSCLLH